MSRIDRRQMLKVMAASAAGGAAAAVTGLGGSVPVMASTSAPSPPMEPNGQVGGSRLVTSPRVLATTPGVTYKYLDGLSDFTFRNSSTTWAQAYVIQCIGIFCFQIAYPGSIYPISGIDSLWTNLKLPQGATLTEIILTVIVNDANAAAWSVITSGPSQPAGVSLASGLISTQSGNIQNVSLSIPPTTIDNSQFIYGLSYGFGTANSPLTHMFIGARLGWMLNPGLTLFPDPRRLVDGFTTPFASGTTYGPFNATVKAGGVTPSGVPVGAKAAFCAVQSYTAGALTVYPDGAADPLIANYTATTSGPLNLTYMMVPLSTAGKFKIHSYISGACFVDAWGFAV